MSISFPQWYSVSNNYPLVFSFNPPFSYSFPLFIPTIIFLFLNLFLTMSPTKQNNSLLTTKPSTTSASVTKKVKKADPKASTATITTNGVVIVQQILQGSHATHIIPIMLSTLPFFHSMVLRVCLVFVAILFNKHYSSISYTQSHGEKCTYHGIMCAWLSEHPEFCSLSPWTANLEGKLVLAPQTATTPIGDAFYLTALTEL